MLIDSLHTTHIQLTGIFRGYLTFVRASHEGFIGALYSMARVMFLDRQG